MLGLYEDEDLMLVNPSRAQGARVAAAAAAPSATVEPTAASAGAPSAQPSAAAGAATSATDGVARATAESPVGSAILEVLAYRRHLGCEQWRVRWSSTPTEPGCESWERYDRLATAALQLVSRGRACPAERPGQPRSTFRLLIGAVAASRPKKSYGKTCWLPAAVLSRALGERSRIIIFTRLARPTSPPVRDFRKPRRPCQLLEAASAVQHSHRSFSTLIANRAVQARRLKRIFVAALRLLPGPRVKTETQPARSMQRRPQATQRCRQPHGPSHRRISHQPHPRPQHYGRPSPSLRSLTRLHWFRVQSINGSHAKTKLLNS